jgi:hypothetical protein
MTADPSDVDRAWGEEMVRRSAQITSGEVQTVTWNEVLAQVAEQRRSRSDAQ